MSKRRKRVATYLLSTLLFSGLTPISLFSNSASAATATIVVDPATYAGSGTTITDTTAGISGTMSNVTYDAASNCGVFSYNGSSSSIQFPQRDFGTNFSISTWVNASQGSTSGQPQYNIQTLMSNVGANVAPSGFKVFINNWESNDGKLIHQAGNGSTGTDVYTNSSNLVSIDQWHHIAFTFNQSSPGVSIYKDGVKLATTGTPVSNIGMNNSNWWLGSMGGYSYYFKGKMGITKIYSSVLSDAEVVQDYNSTSLRYGSSPSCGVSSPTSVGVTAGAGSLDVSWGSPEETSGRTITGYQIEYSTSGTGSWTTASSSIAANSTSYTISGLNTSTAYYVRVAAKYAGGLGAYGYPWTEIHRVSSPIRSSDLIQYESGYGLGAGTRQATYANSGFTRIRYRMQATYSSNNYYVDTDFNRALGTSATYSESFDSIEKIQVPSIAGNNAQFEIQANVSDLNVQSNNPNVVEGQGMSGRLELWPWNYDPVAPSGLSDRQATDRYADADSPSQVSPTSSRGNYGSFQLHTLGGTPSTIFAWNRHFSANSSQTDQAEIGFGSYTGLNSDWTFCINSGASPGCTDRSNFSLGIYINIPTTTLSIPSRTITYALSSGSGTAPTQSDVAQGSSFTVASASAISRSGYTFTGWSDGTSIYQPAASYTVGGSNITLTAQWTANDPISVTFNSTGAAQTWTVPSGVTSIGFSITGGSGGDTHGGKGAVVSGTLAVTAGETLQINVGARGATYPGGSTGNWTSAAFGGGGRGNYYGSGGGGASDIRTGSYALADRVAVAGGGGGGAQLGSYFAGNGGTPVGGNGQPATVSDYYGVGGLGGTQSAGGAGGAGASQCGNTAGSNGTLGVGGDGAPASSGSGGGGGGYYGGGAGGSGCNPIAGGGGSSWVSSSLVTSPSYSVAASLGAGVITITYGGLAPTLTGAAISGTATIGQTLTASTQGAAGGTASTTSYQWKSSSDNSTFTNISGATSSTYVLTSSEIGKYVRVSITVSNTVGTNSATSSSTSAVLDVAPTIGTATITGSKVSGQTLTASAGTLGGGTPTSTTYQWKSSSDNSTFSDISGATSSTYQLTANEIGKYIKVEISLSNTAGSNSATSNATTQIATPSISVGNTIYTTDYNSGLKKRALDGSGTQSTVGSVSAGVQLAASGSYIYIGYGQIRRIGTDGTGITTLRTISDQLGLTISDGYIYYGYEYGKKIGRMDLDGQNANDSLIDFSANSSAPYSGQLTVVNSTIYFGGGGNMYGDKIWKVSVSGGTPTSCITDSQGIGGITSDGTYLYWTNYRTGKVGRALLDCSSANASWITGVSYAWGITHADGYIYFNHYTSSGYIGKASTDLSYLNKTWVSNTSTQGLAIADAGAPAVLSSPSNSSAPSISGNVAYGQTLTAANGTWTSSPTSYTYQWSRASSSGGSYSNIAGATSSTYVLTSSDIGNYLKVSVTATNAAGSASASSSASQQITKATPTFSSWTNVSKTVGDASYTVSAPTVVGGISGTIGYSSSSTSVISVSGNTFTVAGVGSSTITATFTPSDSTLYNSASTTNTVTVLAQALTTPNSAPTVTLTTGSTSSSITVTFSAVSNASSHSVRVYLSNGTTLVGSVRTNFVSGSTITGLTANTAYKVTIQGIGDITNYSNSGESPQASITTSIAPPTIATASFSGTTTVGQILTAATGTLGGGAVASTTYQWKSSSTSGGVYSDISGATSNTYTLTSSEANKYIKVTITVTNTAGSASATSNASAAAVISNNPTPTVSSISPSAGTTAGGTSVTISGTNLSTVSSVTFDGSAATISTKTSTQLVVVTPAHSAGAVDVVITNPAGSITSANGFTYATTPTVRSWTATPSITSGNINDTFTVTYQAVCTTPQRYGPSMYDLIYITPGVWTYNSYMGSGTSTDGGYTWTITKTYTLTGSGIWKVDAYERGACWDSYNFTYATRSYINVGVSGPTITSLNVTSGPSTGDTSTTITGTNLTGVTGITVGGTAATSIRSNTSTSVTFNTPAGTAGAKNVVVTTQAGTATATNGFTYTAPITITYDVNGGSGSPSRTSDSYTPNTGGYSLPVIGTMTRTGHTFSGWATANNSTTAISSPYNPTSSLTVYAIWTMISYTNSYNANGATSGSVPSSTTDAFGSTVTVAGNTGSLARTGYTLAGWNTAANGSGTSYNLGAGTFTQSAANQTLYAEWVPDTFTVSYDRNGSTDSLPVAQTGNLANSTVTLAAGLTKANFAFVGWETGGVTYKAGASFTLAASDVTMVAKWIAVYKLSYNLNGTGASGSVPGDFQYASGDSVTVTNVVPTRTGYEFGGWVDQSGGAHASSSTYTISGTNYLLYAVWNPVPYTITYALNGGQGTAPTETSKNINNSFTVASAPTKTGSTFNGWSDGTNNFGAGSSYLVGSSNVTLTAQWTANSYAITYDLAQGTSSVPSALSKNYQGSWTLPDAPTRVGYNFADWYDGATGYAAAATYTLNTASDLTITARWTAIVYYTVTYDLDGGLGTPPSQDPLQNGQSFTLATDPNKTGFSFTGWSYAGTTYSSGQTITMPAANVTVTALWTATSAGTYAITYISNGAQTSAPTVPALAENATFTVDDGSGLIKNGYIFSGWSRNGTTYNGGETFTMPASSVTFSAVWVPSVRATAVSHSVDATSITRGRSITITYSLGCYAYSSTIPTIFENVSTTGESFINDITSALTVIDAGYNWTVTRVYTLSRTGTYTIFATASSGCFSASTDSISSTVTVTEAPSNAGGGGSSAGNSNSDNTNRTSTSQVGSIQPVTVVGARVALVANKNYTLPKLSATTLSVEAKTGASASSSTTTTQTNGTTLTTTTMLSVNTASKGLSEVKIVENQLAVVPTVGFSGKTDVTITVTDGSTTTTVVIPVTVLPEPVKDPVITPVAARQTSVTWEPSPNANSYQVIVDGKTACKAATDSCEVKKILGPNADVQVIANGGDATKSEAINADYDADKTVVVTKLVGRTKGPVLTANDINLLNRVITTVKTQGFETVTISQITTTKVNAAAAKARVDSLVNYVKSKSGNPDLIVRVVPASTKTSMNQIAVK